MASRATAVFPVCLSPITGGRCTKSVYVSHAVRTGTLRTQFTLATANGHHGVDGLETGLYGLVDGLTGQDTGGLELGTALLGGLDGTLSVDGVAESVDNTSEKGLADGNVDLLLLAHAVLLQYTVVAYNLSGTLDGLALLDQSIGTEQHNTDLAGFEVHAHALDTGGEPATPLASWRWVYCGGLAYSTSSSAWTLFMPWTRAIPSLSSSSAPYPSSRIVSSHTQRRGHVRSRRGCSPPGHRGSSAPGWRRPRWGKPSHRRHRREWR